MLINVRALNRTNIQLVIFKLHVFSTILKIIDG